MRRNSHLSNWQTENGQLMMSEKLYVEETTDHDEEGKPLTVIQTYESNPKQYSYLIFLDK